MIDLVYRYWPEVSANKPEGVDCSKSSKGQILAFFFIANHLERANHMHGMFNDSIMCTYIVLCIHAFARNHLKTGIFWFSMAYGLKAGALLLFPPMLGSIQYYHGTIKLLLSIAAIVVFQIVIALPIVLHKEEDN